MTVEPPKTIVSAWVRKFRVAIAGIVYAVRHQNSFWVHLPVASVVFTMAFWLQLELWRWVALVVATAMVISAELLNTAIENLVSVLHPEHDVKIGHALDAAAGGVLVTAIGSVAIGLIVFVGPIWQQFMG